MKNLLIGVLFLSFSTYGQTKYAVEESSNSELIVVLNSAEFLSETGKAIYQYEYIKFRTNPEVLEQKVEKLLMIYI